MQEGRGVGSGLAGVHMKGVSQGSSSHYGEGLADPGRDNPCGVSKAPNGQIFRVPETKAWLMQAGAMLRSRCVQVV